jgi:hypothetical protein
MRRVAACTRFARAGGIAGDSLDAVEQEAGLAPVEDHGAAPAVHQPAQRIGIERQPRPVHHREVDPVLAKGTGDAVARGDAVVGGTAGPAREGPDSLFWSLLGPSRFLTPRSARR